MNKILSRTDIIHEISRQLRPILQKYTIEQAVLFGSLATGGCSRRSDVDLILVQSTQKRFLDRYEGILQEITTALLPREVDLLIYTSEEIQQIADRPFIQKAFQEGVVIYESEKKSMAG